VGSGVVLRSAVGPPGRDGPAVDDPPLTHDDQLVGEVDRGAHVVGDDPKDVAGREGVSGPDRHRGVVLGERDDAGVGVVGQPSGAGGPRRLVGSEDLAPGVEDDPVGGAAHDGGDGGERDPLPAADAELYLLGVVEDVDPGPQLARLDRVANAALVVEKLAPGRRDADGLRRSEPVWRARNPVDLVLQDDAGALARPGPARPGPARPGRGRDAEPGRQTSSPRSRSGEATWNTV